MGYIMDLREHVGHNPLIMVSACVLILNERKQLLPQKRRDNGFWSYPGGSMELGESFEECAKREILEETGLECLELTYFTNMSGEKMHYVYPNEDEVYIAEIVFICDKYKGDLKIQESEVLEQCFFDLDKLPNNISPINNDVIQLVANQIKFNSKITKVYFVRHAEPEHTCEDDRTRPLTPEGKQDSKIVLDFFKNKQIDVFYSSPYKRSYDTIADTAIFYGKEIITDERLRERENGIHGNNHGMFEKRWANHDYHEENGESINMVQKRNISALTDILIKNNGKKIVIGTHGTALSTILNFYHPEFGCEDFLRIIDWMPYIVELDFDGGKLLSIKEHCHIEKEWGLL